ncbi:uncharacterized protein BDZ99DRAFT_482724 [Mytilinidion resinicola]|uniref:Uncharacterized protein n=1 Tax=Mytilinidion resinicola TaxID=574789 RepID=A0A6A6Y206_9PEZI|nr:uncharacterized protein BDZ99DRAFT_482724 [Mytilinidion resinicola]KAF2802588.1 hypothetical protein BDZ99DRAFT_482724 [Mytilinidion resinicola]
MAENEIIHSSRMARPDHPTKVVRSTIYDRAVAKAARPPVVKSPTSGSFAAKCPTSGPHVANSPPSSTSMRNSIMSSPRTAKSSASTPPSATPPQGCDHHGRPTSPPKQIPRPQLTLAQYLGHETPPDSLDSNASETSYVTYKPTTEERVARMNSDEQQQRASRSTMTSAPPSFTTRDTKRGSSEIDETVDMSYFDTEAALNAWTEHVFAIDQRKVELNSNVLLQIEGYRDHKQAKRPRYEAPIFASRGANIPAAKESPVDSKAGMSFSKACGSQRSGSQRSGS